MLCETTAPHKTTYWQKAHLGILRLFAAHYLRPSRSVRAPHGPGLGAPSRQMAGSRAQPSKALGAYV